MKSQLQSNSRKAKIGDVVEIVTPKGLAYVQYTHKGGVFGELVRVLPGLHRARPADLDELVKLKELYFVFYTLNSALSTGEARTVANKVVPKQWTNSYPAMRHSAATDENGTTIRWRIISAACKLTLQELQNTTLISQLSPEQRSLSIFEIWAHPVMVRELARVWTPEHSEELRLNDLFNRRADDLPVDDMRHYFYFSKREGAVLAEEWLHGDGFDVERRDAAEGQQWLVLASKHAPKTADEMNDQRQELERLAARLDGEYDGWESHISSHEGVPKIQKIN